MFDSELLAKLARLALLVVLLAPCSAALAEPDVEEAEIAMLALATAIASENASEATPLRVLEQSSFPRHAHALEQLRSAAMQGYCGMEPTVSVELLERLIANNSSRVAWSRMLRVPRIAWVQTPQQDLDFVGLSVPAIYEDGQSAIIGMDISGASGVLMLMRKAGDQWSVIDGCVEWTSWR